MGNQRASPLAEGVHELVAGLTEPAEGRPAIPPVGQASVVDDRPGPRAEAVEHAAGAGALLVRIAAVQRSTFGR